MGKSKVKRQFKLGWRNKDLLILIIGTGVALHRLSLNITKYAASNSSESPERHATRCPDFAANEERLFERSFENHLLRVRSILGRMKRKLPSRIEPNVSKPWPLIGLTTSRCLLKERTFFLEKLQHALG